MNITKLRKKQIKKKDELNDLSNKFKELKSLIYDYRDSKEAEIEKTQIEEKYKTLLEEHENLSKKLEDLKKKKSWRKENKLNFLKKLTNLIKKPTHYWMKQINGKCKYKI